MDILALPGLNSINATLLGIDADGNLLYCAPGLVAQPIPLPPPDTNWGRVTAFTLDSGNLYVLDSPARAVWVYNGKDGTFIDRPYFFFGQQTPTQDVIDIIVSGDELYMLHADGHLSNCSYSRLVSNSSQCRIRSLWSIHLRHIRILTCSTHTSRRCFLLRPDQSILLLMQTQAYYVFSVRLNCKPVPPNTEQPTRSHPNCRRCNRQPKSCVISGSGGQVYFATCLDPRSIMPSNLVRFSNFHACQISSG